MITSRRSRRTLLIAVLVFDAIAVAYAAVDTRARQGARERSLEARLALAEVIGSPDLALSSSSRWLRHPSLSEPSAAFADGPATFDTDPGGAFVPPRVPPGEPR